MITTDEPRKTARGSRGQRDPLSSNVRLRYNYRPDSDVFVIYTLGSQFNSVAAGNPVLLRTSRFTVKFTYSWTR